MLFGSEADDDDGPPATSPTSTEGGTATTTPAPGSAPDAGEAASGGAPSAGAPASGGQLGDAGAVTAGGVIGSAGEAGAGGANPCGCAVSESCCDDVCVDTESDPAHCGACEHDCLGGECAAGLCQPVLLWQAPDDRSIKDIDADATDVYFLEGPIEDELFPDPDTIWTIAEAGGDPIELADQYSLPETEITVGGGFVYWAYWTLSNRIRRVLSGGGMLETFTESPGLHSRHMFATEQALYWTNAGNSGGVYTAPHDSAATITTLASGFSASTKVIVDGDWVYFIDNGTKRLAKVPTAGGDVVDLATNLGTLGGLAIYGDHAFFTATTLVYRASAAGGGEATEVFDMGAYWSEIAADSSGLYVGGSNLTRLALDGTNPVTLYDQPVQRIALADNVIYLSTGSELFRLAK